MTISQLPIGYVFSMTYTNGAIKEVYRKMSETHLRNETDSNCYQWTIEDTGMKPETKITGTIWGG